MSVEPSLLLVSAAEIIAVSHVLHSWVRLHFVILDKGGTSSRTASLPSAMQHHGRATRETHYEKTAASNWRQTVHHDFKNVTAVYILSQICQRSRGRTCFHLREQLKRGCSALSHKPKLRLIRVIGTVHSVPVQRHALHALVAQVRHDLVAHSMTILSRRSRSEAVFSALLPRISSTRGVGPFNVRRRLGTSCAALPAASPVSCSEFLSIGGDTTFNIRDA